jgi:hypothetical protein
MKRTAFTAIAFLLLAFPAVVVGAIVASGCCVIPCHATEKPMVPMCSATAPQPVVKIAATAVALRLPDPVLVRSGVTRAPFAAVLTPAIERDVSLYLLLGTLLI